VPKSIFPNRWVLRPIFYLDYFRSCGQKTGTGLNPVPDRFVCVVPISMR
jgi:hypothetical protein